MPTSAPWYLRRPSLLVAELEELARDFPEFQQVQASDYESVVFMGELTIRSNCGARPQKLALIYPDDYDYAPPIVVPLQQDAEAPTGPIQRFNFRHQMPKGELCLFERDTTHLRVRGVDALRRAERWLHEQATGQLSPELDTLAAELEEHYMQQGCIVAGPTVLDGATTDRGQLVALQLYAAGVLRYVLTHAVVGGTVLDDRAVLKGLVTSWGGPRDEFWSYNMAGLGQLAKDHPEHFWSGEFRTVPEEPPIFHEVEALARFLYPEAEDAIAAFVDEHGTALVSNAGIIIALRYPARGGDGHAWLFLRLKLRAKDVERVEVQGLAERGIVLDFESPRDAVLRRAEIGVLTLEDLRRTPLQLRNHGRVAENIGDLRIVMAGVGALGSVAADLFARSGIGALDLHDLQPLRSGNVLRHVGGLAWIGLPKVVAVATAIAQHTPYCDTNISGDSILTQPPDALTRGACVVSTIASDATELALNERCVESGATLYLLSAQRAGNVGCLIRVQPFRDACFECVQRHLGGEFSHLRIPPQPGEIVAHECGSPVLAASAPDLAAVAAIGVRRILDDVASPQETNHWLWTTSGVENVEGLRASMAEIRTTLPPHSSCQTCAPRPVARIVVNAGVRERMVELSRQKFPNETGGILLGRRDGDVVHITAVSDSGPGADESPAGFLRDGAHCQAILEEAIVTSSGAVTYLGEWHSHPKHEATPSPTDVASLASISMDAAFNTPCPVMLIIGLADRNVPEVLHGSAYPERSRGYAVEVG